MDSDSIYLSVPRSICCLVGYHSAKLSRDEEEWRCWGGPCARMCAASLCCPEVVVPKTRKEALEEPVMLTEIRAPTSPVADGVPSCEDSSWNVIKHNHEHFKEILVSLRDEENRETLKISLGLLISKNFEMGNYDSRVRAIMTSVFNIVELPMSYLYGLESQFTLKTGPYFNQADISVLGSAVTPYRSLQVCAVALSTGAVMYGVGMFTAPTILMAIRQLVSTGLLSTSSGQMLAGSGLVDAAAISRLLVAMPQLCSTAVASTSAIAGFHSASTRMIHRTSPIAEFNLSPLFLPRIRVHEYCDTDPSGGRNTTKQSCLIFSNGNGVGGTVEEASEENIYLNSSLVVIEGNDDENKEDKCISGLKPVFFLLAGHIGNETDLRDIFGAVPQVVETWLEEEPSGSVTEPEFTVNKLAAIVDTAAEEVIGDTLTTVGEDLDKLERIIHNATGEDEESSFLTSPSLVEKNWWRNLFPRGEEYIVQWERTELADLNDKIRQFLEGKVIAHAVNAALAHFALTALWSSFSWANFVLDELSELDAPWAVALDRSKQAGRMLARLLLSNKFCQMESEELLHCNNKTKGSDHLSEGSDGVVIINGETFTWDDCTYENIRRGRPVTLIGYSMGARVIYHCLEELDACVPAVAGRGLVENVVLMGTPVSTDFNGWSAARRVVSGRLINCYSRKDWFLALMYRSNMYEPTVAGLQPFSLLHSKKFGIKTGGFCFMTSPPTPNAAKAVSGISSIDGLESKATVTIEADPAEKMESWSEDIECVDVSDLIKSHADYPNQVGRILKRLDLEPRAHL